MESNRQKKINQLLQEELAIIFQQQSANMQKGILISVTDVKVSPDLGVARVYLSIFPQQFREDLMKEINLLNSQVRKMIGNKLSKQLRQIPELLYFLDTTLDDVEKIERALRGEDEKPIL